VSEGRPVHFELGQRVALEALHQHQVGVIQVAEQLGQNGLVIATQLVHQRPAPTATDQDLAGTGLAVTVAVFARLVDVEVVVGVLHQRHAQTLVDQHRNDLLDEGGLAAAGEAGKAEDAHEDGRGGPLQNR